MSEPGERLFGFVRPPLRRPAVVTKISAARDRRESRFPDEIEPGLCSLAPDLLAVDRSGTENDTVVGEEFEERGARSFFLASLKESSFRLDMARKASAGVSARKTMAVA